MRRGMLLLVAMALLVPGAGCGRDRTRVVRGVAFLEPHTVDFGRVGLGTTTTRTVELKNQARAPYRILGWELDGLGEDFAITIQGRRTIREGDTTQLVLRYSPEEEEQLARTLRLQTDHPEQPVLEVALTGVAVRPHVVADPPALDFGRVELGVRQVLPLELRNDFDIDVDVRIGSRGDEQFGATPEHLIRVGPMGSATVEVSFEPERLGTVRGDLGLVPCAACEEVVVPLEGTGIDRALVVVPPEVDFGYVPVERSAERSFTVTNVSSRPVEIQRMELVGDSQNFTLHPMVGMLAPGDGVQVLVEFSPTLLDPEEQVVEIHSSSARAPVTEVRLRGAGGGPQIQITPPRLSFGMVPLGSRGQIPLRITNAGATPAAPPLEILDIRVENPGTAPFGPDRDLVADPVRLAAGAQDTVYIGYEPLVATPGVADTAELVVVSNDASLPEIRLPMSGFGVEVPPCSHLEVAPEGLDFGALDASLGATLTFRVFNPGPEMCIMRNLRLAPGSDPVFRVREVQSFLIPAGQWFGWMVAFDPRAEGAGEGAYRGEVELFAINATGPQRYSIPLRAMSDNGCLLPEPNFVDFGSERSGCAVGRRTVRFTNLCPLPLGIGPITIGAQPYPGDFEIVRAPTPPFDLGSGASFEVEVQWNTVARGQSSAPLYVAEDTRPRPLLVPLLGELQHDGNVVDRFVQQREDAVDVLLVVDNSSTMVEEQPRLRAASHVLLDEADRMGIDVHVGVTTTGLQPSSSLPACPGGADGGEAGRLFPVDGARPRFVTNATPNARGILAANTQVGFCHEMEQGMEAMRLALSEPLRSGSNRGFLRRDAALSVIFVSDENDHSGYPVQDYVAFLEGLKGRGGGVAHSIVDVGAGCPEGAGRASRLIELSQETGGVVESLCQSDWSAAMRRIAARGYTLRTAFSLSAVPDDDGITVRVDGVEADPSHYRYDPGSNSIAFASAFRPRPGATVEVRYHAACD